MWLVKREQTDGCTIRHARNRHEYRPPELTRLSVDGFCAEMKTIDEFFGCLYYGHTCIPFHDVNTLGCDTLAQKYEQSMARLQRIIGAVYTVEVVLECQFDKDILPRHPELKHHPTGQHDSPKTLDVLYGGRTETMVLQYLIRD